MAKRSSGLGGLIIVLLLIAIGVLGFMFLADVQIEIERTVSEDSSSDLPPARGGNEGGGSASEGVDGSEEPEGSEESEGSEELEGSEESEVSEEQEPSGESISNFTFEGGLETEMRDRIERIMNESQGYETGSDEYEYLQGTPVLSEDGEKVYFITARDDYSFVGVYEMVLDGYEWTRIYRREYDSNPEIAILRVAGRDGDNLIILAGNQQDYQQRDRVCYFSVLEGSKTEDGLLALPIDEDPNTGLAEYDLDSGVLKHADSLYQDCLANQP